MDTAEPESLSSYAAALDAYLASPSRESRQVSLLGRALVRMGLGPAEIVLLHTQVVQALAQELSKQDELRLSTFSHHFLLEVMLSYADQYRVYMTQQEIQAASDASASLQAEQLEHSRELVQVGLDKDATLMTVAHELRTPLTAAKMMTELSQVAFAQGRTEQVPDYLTRLAAAIDTLAHLVGNLTEVVRNEPATVELGPVDVTVAAEQACSWILPAANAKGVKINPPAAAGVLVHGNVEALVSIVSNLLSNAVRYSPSGATVDVRVGVSEGMAVVEVQDTGLGMSPEVLSHIYERFYRAPDAKRSEPRGLGVGLAIVEQLVEAQGGEITAESTVGQGSTFRVTLPLSGSSLPS